MQFFVFGNLIQASVSIKKSFEFLISEALVYFSLWDGIAYSFSFYYIILLLK